MSNYFTQAEDQYLRDNYLTMPAKAMSRKLNRSESGAWQRMKLLGLVVPKEITDAFKAGSQFKKGERVWNKGMKGLQIGGIETQFKKGHLPTNHKPVGSTRVSRDGYLELKVVDPDKWVSVHRDFWEELFGEIPKGFNVQFVDGNKRNIAAYNLELVSKKENMNRNTYHRYPKEIASAIQLMGVLRRKINNKSKRLYEK